jgi:L-arabinose isomerase
MGARKFMDAWNAEGPAHHCAIGIGHISSKLSKLGQLLGMECTVIE